MLLVDLTRSQPRVSTGLILPAVARNHLKRAPQGRGEHTLAAAARAAATWTRARETPTNSRAIDQARHTTTTWERPPASSAPTLPPPPPRARQISATKQAQDNGPSTGRVTTRQRTSHCVAPASSRNLHKRPDQQREPSSHV